MLEADTRDGVALREAGDVEALDDGLDEPGDCVAVLKAVLLAKGDVENKLEAEAAGHTPEAHTGALRSTIALSKQAVPSAASCTAYATPA